MVWCGVYVGLSTDVRWPRILQRPLKRAMIQDRSMFDSETQGLLAGVHDHVCSELGIAPRAEVGEDPTVTVLREVIERTLINSAACW